MAYDSIVGSLRFARLAAPFVLTGCTVLSGAASLQINEEQAADPITTKSPTKSDAGTTSGSSSSSSSTSSSSGAPHNSSDAAPPVDEEPIADGGNVMDGGTGSSTGGPPTPDASGGPAAVTLTFTKTLKEGEQASYGPFNALGGTIFDAKTTGSGDDDLFLRFNAPPTVKLNDCSSDYDGPNERCKRTVPQSGAEVYLLVDAWLDCSYTLTVTYTPAQ